MTLDPGNATGNAGLSAGAVAGLSGLAVFLTLHHIWIQPIWFIAPVGAVIAAGGGAAVGLAYVELQPRLPGRPWTGVAVFAGAIGALTPSIVIAQARGAIFGLGLDGARTLLVPAPDAVADVVFGLFVVTAATAAGLGWLVGRTRRAAGTAALAGLALAVGPGHNIPLLGGTRAAATELAILAAVGLIASIALVESHLAFRSRGVVG